MEIESTCTTGLDLITDANSPAPYSLVTQCSFPPRMMSVRASYGFRVITKFMEEAAVSAYNNQFGGTGTVDRLCHSVLIQLDVAGPG